MHTVLVVDDDPQVCDLVVLTLREEARCRTLAAARGQTAIELATAQRPDALLLDVRLPDMDGFAVCRVLKAQPSTADMSIIFLTALHDTASELLGLACGAVDYMRKPFTPEVLVARLQRVLAERDRRAAVLRENVTLRARLQRGAPRQVVPWEARATGSAALMHAPDGIPLCAPGAAPPVGRRRGRPRLTTAAFVALDRAVLAGLIVGQTEREIAEAQGFG